MSVSGPDEEGGRRISIHSRAEAEDAEWTEHASGSLSADERAADEAPPPPEGEEIDPEVAYARLAEAGYEYGPAFQGLRRLVRAGDTIYAEVGLAEEQASRAPDFGLHPALLDAALQAAALAGLDSGGDGRPEIPFSFSGVRLHRARRRLAASPGDGRRALVAPRGERRGRHPGGLDRRPRDAAAGREPPGHPAGPGARRSTRSSGRRCPRRRSRTALRLAALGEGPPLDESGEPAIERYADLEALADAVAAGAEAPEQVLVAIEPDAGRRAPRGRAGARGPGARAAQGVAGRRVPGGGQAGARHPRCPGGGRR